MEPSADPQRTPEAEYQVRLARLRQFEGGYKTYDDRLAYTILALIVAALIVGFWLLVTKGHSIYWIVLPIFVFVICAVIHTQVLRALRNCRRAVAFYERGLARLGGEWAGHGQTGGRFLELAHPYARDLDIFGQASLFELLCTARTRAGEEVLANWLLAAAPPEEVTLRQAAVSEMRDRLAFREDLFVLSEGVDAAGHPDALAAWGEGTSSWGSPSLRVVLPVLAGLWVISLVAWLGWGLWPAALLMSLLNTIVFGQLKKRAEVGFPAIDAAVREVQLIADVLERLEREPFSSPKLVALQGRFRSGGACASRAIVRLAQLTQSFESRRSYLVAMLDPFIFWGLQHGLAIEAWRKRFGPQIRGWVAALGEMEALSDVAGYSYEHPDDVFPEFTADAPQFEARGVAHPLISEQNAVRNDVNLGREVRLLIVSGPNMAGKSTFIRAVGVNVVLAQCGAPVRARKLTLSPLTLGASVCILDSLQGGVSRFYAEITRLKLIMDMMNGPTPVLFLLDELLSGTNSHDRRIGSEAIVRALVQRNAVGMITTHDLALAEIAESFDGRAANVHFQDRLDAGRLRFDYRLTPGVVQTSNALELMRAIGLDV